MAHSPYRAASASSTYCLRLRMKPRETRQKLCDKQGKKWFGLRLIFSNSSQKKKEVLILNNFKKNNWEKTTKQTNSFTLLKPQLFKNNQSIPSALKSFPTWFLCFVFLSPNETVFFIRILLSLEVFCLALTHRPDSEKQMKIPVSWIFWATFTFFFFLLFLEGKSALRFFSAWNWHR